MDWIMNRCPISLSRFGTFSFLNVLSLRNSQTVAEWTCLDVHFKGCRKLRLKSSKSWPLGVRGQSEAREGESPRNRINQRELRGLQRADSWPAEAKSPQKKYTYTHMRTDTNTLTPEKLLKYSAALSTSKNPASAALDKLQIPHNNNMLQETCKRGCRADDE